MIPGALEWCELCNAEPAGAGTLTVEFSDGQRAAIKLGYNCAMQQPKEIWNDQGDTP